MNRWTLLILIALVLPACAQDMSKAGIPFSPTQQFSYNTATYAPPGGYSYNTGYYGYGRTGNGYYYSGYGYGNGSYGTPGSYHNAFGGNNYAPTQSSRSWPSAAQESRLHEIRR